MSPKVSSQGYGMDSNTLAMLQRDQGQVVRGKRLCAKIVISPIWQSVYTKRSQPAISLGGLQAFFYYEQHTIFWGDKETLYFNHHIIFLEKISFFTYISHVAERPRSGRPRKTTMRQDRYLSNMAKRQRFQSAVGDKETLYFNHHIIFLEKISFFTYISHTISYIYTGQKKGSYR
jgi:hypothetical protein